MVGVFVIFFCILRLSTVLVVDLHILNVDIRVKL